MIWFCGDPHGKFSHIIRAVQQHRPAAVILLGDNFGGDQASKTLEQELAQILDLTEVWCIYGNHETDYESTTQLMLQTKERSLHGRVVEIAGYKVAGLGGIFRGKIWNPRSLERNPGESEQVFNNYEEYKAAADLKRPKRLRRPSAKEVAMMSSGFMLGDHSQALAAIVGEDRKHLSSIFQDDYEALVALEADILVTHEAPSCHPHGFSAIDELAQAMKVKRLFHGHHHDNLDYSAHYERLGFVPRGVGLRGITDLDGNVIVKGEIDDARMYRNQRLEE